MSKLVNQDIFSPAKIAPSVIPASRLELKLASSNLVIEAGPCIATAFAKGVLTQGSLLGGDLKPELDITFDCNGYDDEGNYGKGIAYAYALAYGSIPFVDFEATATAYGIASATPIWGSVFSGTALAYGFAYGDLLLENLRANLIKWSNVGSLDFTIGRDNVAGERRTDWVGWIYEIKKLGNKVVAYGENGVSMLIPSGNNYGLNTIYRIGLKSKQAVTGNDAAHYFIDNKGQLFSLGETLQKLDYSEYLSAMNNPVMSYNAEIDLVYMCDGTLGYVYSPRDKSFGSGPINLTGISSQDETLYAVSPATIVIPNFEICTDIYDLGTRKLKTVFSLEFGIDLDTTLQVSIDYRRDKTKTFAQTSWHVIDEGGFVKITCNGREFRFRVQALNWEYFEIDYININGEILSY